jgi:plastocyanin
MKKFFGLFIVLGLLWAGIQVAQAGDAGSVSGKVRFKGNPPPPKKVAISTDTAICGSEQQSEDAVVGADKGLKYAVVHLVGVKGAAADTKTVALEQKGCKFAPHVLVVPKGAEFDILNGDGISHNIHSHSTTNPEINKAQPGFKKKMSQKFDAAEHIKLSCDVHPWMNGWIVVAEDSYVTVTDESGSFKLPNVPPGTYKLEVWHEKFGTQTKEVVVKGAADSSVSFELGG